MIWNNTLETLERRNFNEWQAAIMDFCIIADTQWNITNTAIDPHGMVVNSQSNFKSSVRSLTRKSISAEVWG